MKAQIFLPQKGALTAAEYSYYSSTEGKSNLIVFHIRLSQKSGGNTRG